MGNYWKARVRSRVRSLVILGGSFFCKGGAQIRQGLGGRKRSDRQESPVGFNSKMKSNKKGGIRAAEKPPVKEKI